MSMAQDEVALYLKGLTKRFGLVTAVDQVDLEIRRGEFLTLLGPSGSGKSTTLHLIAGFESPTEGEVYLEGRPISRVPPHRRGIGIVFQNYALFPHLNVFENIAFALRNRRRPEAEIRSRVAELLTLVKLEGLEKRLPAQLSGGQQQRVALARALSFHPYLLLLDEPIGALDKKLREHMLLEFRRIHRILGTTMVYVTHDQVEALVMSDRVAVMDHGRIVRLGTPRELYEDPRSPFVADFLGDANVLSGSALLGDAVQVDDWIIAVAHSKSPGAPVQVVVRPEKIVIGPPPHGWNAASGSIEEILYLGDATKYQVRTGHGHLLSIKEVNRGPAASYAVGSEVSVAWHPDDGRVLEEPGSGVTSP
jgi:putative spermidine/putrescine transport system ATP-binding protein